MGLPTWHRQLVISNSVYGTNTCMYICCALASFFLLSVCPSSLPWCLRFSCATSHCMPYANCLAKKPTEQVRLSVSQIVLFYHNMPPARHATPRQLQLHLYHHHLHHHRHPHVGCHHYPVDASRFIHVFCYASSLSLSFRWLKLPL